MKNIMRRYGFAKAKPNKMKGRKNIFKIAITSVLSATMCLTGALAVKSVMPAKAFADTTVNTSSIVDNVVYSGGNAAVTYGENTDATGKAFTGLKLTGSSGATFDLGMIDLAKSYWNGVDMSFGTAYPISKLSETVQSTNMQAKSSVTEENPRDYNKFLYDEVDIALNSSTGNAYYTKSGSDSFANFIAFAYAPHVDMQSAGAQEMESFTIRLTDVNDTSNYLEIKSQNQGDSNASSARIGAKGSTQSKYTGLRKDWGKGPAIYEGMRVKQFPHGGTNQIPYELCYSQNWSATSAAEREPALYSPNGSDASPAIAGTWCLRKFAKISDYPEDRANDTVAWNGFSGSKVTVSITFTNVGTVTSTDGNATNEGVTSLIVTSLGGYDLTKTQQTLTDGDYFDGAKYNAKNPSLVLKGEDTALYAPVKSSVITSTAMEGSYVEIYNGSNELESTVTFNNATETYAFKKTGTYTLKWYDEAGSLIKTTTVKSVTTVVDVDKDIASKITSNTGSAAYIANKKQVSNNNLFSGIRLTGVTGSTFNLGNFKLDSNKLYWKGNVKDNTQGMYTGTNDRNKAANADNAKSYGSFFSYVYDPNNAAVNTGDLEVYQMIVTLTEVGNESNWMSVSLTRTYYDDIYTKELQILAAATNNVTYGVERHYAAGTKLGTAARKNYAGDGTATQPLDLVWDNEKATVYTNTSFEYNADGIGGAWALRQFTKDATFYKDDAYTTRNYSPWNGFTDGATLNCTVEFANVKSSEPTSIIVTCLGGVDLTNATYPADMTAETSDANGVAGVECNLLDSVWYTDGLAKVDAGVEKVTVQKDGAEATEVDLTAAKTYRFADNGEYSVTYYDKFDQVIGASTYTISALTANITVTGGEIRRKADGTVVKSGDELSLDDVLTFVPTGSVQNSKTTIDFDVLRSLTVNGSAITAAEKRSEFQLNVADYVSGATIDIVAVFDAEVKVYMTDSRKELTEQLVETLWASDGKYTFTGYESINFFIQSHFKELSDGSYDMLLGFGRYQMIDGVKTSIVNAPVLTKQYLSVVEPYNDYSVLYKENYLEALYINVKTSYQVRVGVDESDSGLRMVTELKQADVDLYNFYNENGLGMIVRTNYTILNHLQEAKGKDFDIKTITAEGWMTGGWDPVPGQANTLGLYATGQDVDTTGKPLFYQYYSQSLKLMNKMVSGVSDGYIGYAVTLRNFNEANINQDYVFQSTWTVDGSTGGATGCVGYAKTAKMSTLATEVYNAAFGEVGSEYQYAVTVDGETRYSKYNQNQIDWLRKMSGKA